MSKKQKCYTKLKKRDPSIPSNKNKGSRKKKLFPQWPGQLFNKLNKAYLIYEAQFVRDFNSTV